MVAGSNPERILSGRASDASMSFRDMSSRPLDSVGRPSKAEAFSPSASQRYEGAVRSSLRTTWRGIIQRYEVVVGSSSVQACLTWWRRGLKRARPWCIGVIDNVKLQVFMFLITVYALVGEDVRMVSYTSNSDDLYFNIVTICALLLFSFEMVCSCIGKDDYFLSFFFFLDLVATSSLILDITWVYEVLILGGDTSVARAGRMSRVGTRAGRVIRVIRLLRLIRILKLYKHILDMRRRMKDDDDKTGPGRESPDEEVYAESRVGQKLSQMTTQKVIVLILSMLIMLPIISVEAWFRETPTAAQYGADVVNTVYQECRSSTIANATAPFAKGSADEAALRLACLRFERHLTMFIGAHHLENHVQCEMGVDKAFNMGCKLGLAWVGFKVNAEAGFGGFTQQTFEQHWARLYPKTSDRLGVDTLRPDLMQRLNSGSVLDCPDNPYGPDYRYVPVSSQMDLQCPEDLRLMEMAWVEPQLMVAGYAIPIVFVFDQRPHLLRSSVYSMLQTVFICLVLALGAMFFSRDANVLVLQPIERMISLVQKIRDNPLYAMKLGDESYRAENGGLEESATEQGVQTGGCWGCIRRFNPCRRQTVVKEQTMETKILENAIVKLGKLLALGFGEAGSEIIVKNMGDDTATVNPMIPGNKVNAVFGFCDITHFTDMTEVLQDKVMLFVNQVAEIVHSIVDAWHGAANRNNGQAFLIVWRMRDEFTVEARTKMGDMSVVSFAQVLAAVNKSAVLKDYREHPALLARIPKFRVRMGFGLHYGWAIEGAIGSDFKIDASYLSPHVNMASRLEAATRHYQVEFLVSEPFVQICSAKMASTFRAIDQVTFKGGMSTPIRLFSVDLRGERLIGKNRPLFTSTGRRNENQFEVRRIREKAKDEKLQESFNVYEVFVNDSDLALMREKFHTRFFQQYSKGFFNYQAGEWGVARTVFSSTVNMLPWTDGPSEVLLEYMGNFGFDSSKATPKGWPGHRELTEAEA
mmetsp:Transcript_39516/g.113706  ORF Transcript_39516/g.113706 Transcript_39516/m.113706 type:complete len:980 (+) Transcript_39516:112-3051(+)